MVISEFGTKEAQRMNINASHLQIGIDTEAWKMVTPEDKMKMRGSFGFDENTFVVLTVADNQERKNLVAGMDMFAEFSKDKENVKYVMVTREHNRVGWKLRNYAQEIGISENLLIFERGMSHEQLWTTYAVSDVFLLPSKAEGLGLPLLEAMAVGIPCIATNCTGMKELLSGRGYLVDYEYTHRDPFGNGSRYWINKHHGFGCLNRTYYREAADGPITDGYVKDARKYVESRTWDIAVEQMEKALLETVGENENG